MQTHPLAQIEERPMLRTVSRVTRAGSPHPGFAGPGHTAVEVFGPTQIGRTDPFVMLMEDRLDFYAGQPVGEAHPHAGLETVTLMLEGSLNDPAFGILDTGDVEWMTAGRGIVHSENVTATGRARILQLWVALPEASRLVEPSLQIVALGTLPIRREPGVEARLYSGRSGGLVSPTRNLVPVTLVDFRLDANASVSQKLPGGHSGFLYAVDGSLAIGEAKLVAGDVAWFDPADATETELVLQAQANGARVILYAGAPIGEPLAQKGPFVAGSFEEIAGFYRSYRAGAFPGLTRIPNRPAANHPPSNT